MLKERSTIGAAVPILKMSVSPGSMAKFGLMWQTPIRPLYAVGIAPRLAGSAPRSTRGVDEPKFGSAQPPPPVIDCVNVVGNGLSALPGVQRQYDGLLLLPRPRFNTTLSGGGGSTAPAWFCTTTKVVAVISRPAPTSARRFDFDRIVAPPAALAATRSCEGTGSERPSKARKPDLTLRGWTLPTVVEHQRRSAVPRELVEGQPREVARFLRKTRAHARR